MTPTDTEPRKPIRMGEIALALADRAPAAASKPSFHVAREKAGAEQAKTGVFDFYVFDVHVPVCDEFPTADEAHAATVRYVKAFKDELGNGAA